MRALCFLSLVIVMCGILPACQTTSGKPTEKDVSAALARAQEEAFIAAGGKVDPALKSVESAYKKKPKAQTALPYAIALRKAGYANRASIVLAPFAKDKNVSLEIKEEFAAIELDLGRFRSAEQVAADAIRTDPHGAYRAYNYLGLALEAQGRHVEAERAFKKSAELWQGDASVVLNNLGLNLLAQEKLPEAERALAKAAAMAPDRLEIARNLNIVRAILAQPGVGVHH